MTIGQYQRHLNEFPNGNLGVSITLDFHVNGIYQSGILNSANCVLTFTPPRVHSTIWLELIQDATGGRTVSFPGTVVGTPPPINSAANASTVIEMLWNGTNYQFTSNTGAAQTSLSYSNLNGISFGIAGSTLTASYTVPSTAGLISRINVSAGTTSNNLSAITFSNSNNFSFGMNGSVITGSYTVPTLTSNTFSNSNNVSFTTAGGTIVASASFSQTAQTQSNVQGISAGTQLGQTGNIIFSNSNGISFGMTNSSIITASYTVPTQTNQTEGRYAIGNTTGQSSSSTFDARSMSFSGAGVASVGYSGNALIISVPAGIANVNISAGTTSNNLTNFVFSNSNSVSFGLSGSTVTASIGTQNFVFSNSNNVSFGLNGSTITATVTVPNQTAQTIGLYALGNTTQNSSTTLDARTLSFNGLGAVSIGYSNGSIQLSSPVLSSLSATGILSISSNGNTISIGVPAQSVNFSAGTTSNNLSGITFSNSNGISFGLNASTLTASYTVPSTAGLLSAANFSAGTTSGNISNIIFSNSNNISFGLNGSTITGSVAAQTNQTEGRYAIGNTTGQSSSSTFDARSMSFSGAGVASVGYSGNALVISVPAGVANVNISAGTTSNNLTNFVFSNSNNISFGLSGSTITGSYTVPTQTAQTQNIVVPSAGTQTATSGTVVFSNSNGISFGMSGSSQITASYTVPSTAGLLSAINISAGTTSSNVSNFVFSNSNGVSFGLNGSTITGSVAAGAVQTNQTVGLYALGNTTQNSSTTLDARTLSFNGLGAATVGYSNGSIQVSAPVVSSLSATGIISISSNGNTISIGAPVQSINLSAGTTSNNLTNFVLSNSNGVSFGLSGSTLTASVGAAVGQTNQTLGVYLTGSTFGVSSSSTLDARSLSFYGSKAGFVGLSAGSVIFDAVPIVISASNTSAQQTFLQFLNANQMSWSLNTAGNFIAGSWGMNISGGTSSNIGVGLTFTNSNNMSFTNNAGVIAAKAAPKASEVINDSSVNGTTGADALNNLLLEFPNGIGSTASTSFTISVISIGQLTLLTGVNVTITIPTLAASNISQRSKFSFMLYGSGSSIASIVGSGGVTIHQPTNKPTSRYSRYDFECIGSDEWVVTNSQFNLDSNGILNASGVSGTEVSDALNQLQLESFHGTLMIPLTMVNINIGSGNTQFTFTPTAGYVDANATVGPSYFVGMIGPLPAGISINSFTITYKPASGHGFNWPPGSVPSVAIYSQFNGTINLIATGSDTTTNVTSYELAHSIIVGFTAQVVAGTSFWFYFLGESGLHAIDGLQIICASVNCA